MTVECLQLHSLPLFALAINQAEPFIANQKFVALFNSGTREEFPQKERRFKMKIANRQIINFYCLCRMPRMLDMISCDQCKEWYHTGISVTLPQSLYLMKT